MTKEMAQYAGARLATRHLGKTPRDVIAFEEVESSST